MNISVSKIQVKLLSAKCKDIFTKSFGADFDTDNKFGSDIAYVATVNDNVVGMALVHDEPPAPIYGTIGDPVYVYSMCVDPDYRRKGVMTKILSSLETDFTSGLTMHVTHDWVSRYLKNRSWVQHRSANGFTEFTFNCCVPLSNYDPTENVIYAK